MGSAGRLGGWRRAQRTDAAGGSGAAGLRAWRSRSGSTASRTQWCKPDAAAQHGRRRSRPGAAVRDRHRILDRSARPRHRLQARAIGAWSATPPSSRPGRTAGCSPGRRGTRRCTSPKAWRTRIKAGAKLAVEIGYRGTEAATTDRSEVGFYFDNACIGRRGGHAVDAGARRRGRARRQAVAHARPSWCSTRPLASAGRVSGTWGPARRRWS